MVGLTKSESQKCIFVLGPTASGKSAWALDQAQKYNGSIVNIDSIQLYQDLIVGSASPTLNEKKIVPHHLFNYVEAPKEMTAGEYVRDFYELIKSDVRFPLFIVGGTGFYIQALEKGMYDLEPVPESFRRKIETELHQQGPARLYEELLQSDPESKIHINDHYRLVRAIEIIRFTGKSPSQLKKESEKNKNEFPFLYKKIGFDFEKIELEKRVKLRTKNMIENGIIEEVKYFCDKQMNDWSPLQSVGYKETLEYLTQHYTKDWLQEAINQSTMQLIKKQKTWFKRDTSILWSNQESALNQFLS